VKETYIIHVEAERIDSDIMKQIMNMSLSVAAGTYKEVTGHDCKLVWSKV